MSNKKEKEEKKEKELLTSNRPMPDGKHLMTDNKNK